MRRRSECLEAVGLVSMLELEERGCYNRETRQMSNLQGEGCKEGGPTGGSQV